MIKIAPPQTLHQPADHANSHEAEMTFWHTTCFVIWLARRTSQVLLGALLQGLSPEKVIAHKFALTGCSVTSP